MNPEEKKKESSGGLIAAGYIFGLLSIVILPIPFGLAGFVIGIVNLTKGSSGHGIAQIILSALCGIIGMAIGASMMKH